MTGAEAGRPTVGRPPPSACRPFSLVHLSAPMKSIAVLTVLVLLAGCAEAPADVHPSEADAPSPAPTASASGDAGGLVGTWELVEQRGYDPDHPEVEQTLTFTDDGRLTSDQTSGGTTATLAVRYQTDGEQLLFGAVEEMTINGEAIETGGADGPTGEGAPEQTWRIEGGRLVIANVAAGAEDVYRRVR